MDRSEEAHASLRRLLNGLIGQVGIHTVADAARLPRSRVMALSSGREKPTKDDWIALGPLIRAIVEDVEGRDGE